MIRKAISNYYHTVLFYHSFKVESGNISARMSMVEAYNDFFPLIPASWKNAIVVPLHKK